MKVAAAGRGEKPICVGDPAMFKHDGGPSIADQINAKLVEGGHPTLKRADNDRISGWSQIRQRLMSNPAMLYVTTSCPYLIDSLPALQFDLTRTEDVDTTGDDHVADALRYLCKERLLDSEHKKVVEPARDGKILIGEYIAQVRRNNARTQL